MEKRLVQKYGNKVAFTVIDADGDAMNGVQKFVKNLGMTCPLGLEEVATPTYTAITANYTGSNPFPVNVVVGRGGLIQYIARDYYPDALLNVIDAVLAK